MKPSLIFKVSRFIRFLLSGLGKLETEHYLFTLSEPVSDVELYTALVTCGWQPNYIGFIYRGQVYQCRRLVHRGKHQYHIRCYEDGKVTGHFEIAPEYDSRAHLGGEDLRTMNEQEAARLSDNISEDMEPRRKHMRKQ